MFNWKDFEKVKSILSEAGAGQYSDLLGQHHVYLRPKDLLRWIEICRDDLGFLVLIDIVSKDLQSQNGSPRFEVIYLLQNMGTHQRLNLHLYVHQGEIIPSIVSFYSHADWFEREQKEMFNLNFDRKMDALILPEGQKNYPLLKDSNISTWPKNLETKIPELKINPNKSEPPYPSESYVWKKFDILAPETFGNFEWITCFDPQVIVDSKVQIGFNHHGFEKLLEKKDIIGVLKLLDWIQPGAAPTYSIAWTKGLEDVLRIKIPERAQAVRIVMLELARVAEHLTVIYEMIAALNKNEAIFILDLREKVSELFEKYCGHRQGHNISSVGGISQDLPHGWVVEYQTVLDILNKQLPLINRSLLTQKDFKSSLQGESVNAQTILQWGVSGPAMRAAGLNFDLRKSEPFYFYHEIDFDIPVGISGTSFDRYLIRYEEIFQSLRIMTQVIDNLPLGEFINPSLSFKYPEILGELQKLELSTQTHYTSLESPSGEAGLSFTLGPELSVQRIKIKTPSFSLAQSLPALTKGLSEKQIRIGMASFGIRNHEIDR